MLKYGRKDSGIGPDRVSHIPTAVSIKTAAFCLAHCCDTGDNSSGCGSALPLRPSSLSIARQHLCVAEKKGNSVAADQHSPSASPIGSCDWLVQRRYSSRMFTGTKTLGLPQNCSSAHTMDADCIRPVHIAILSETSAERRWLSLIHISEPTRPY